VLTPITSPWPPSKGELRGRCPFKGGIKGALPLQRGNSWLLAPGFFFMLGCDQKGHGGL